MRRALRPRFGLLLAPELVVVIALTFLGLFTNPVHAGPFGGDPFGSPLDRPTGNSSPVDEGGNPGGDPVPPPQIPQPEAMLQLEWTHCEIHRCGDPAQIEFGVPGTVLSSAAVIWTLCALDQGPGAAADLHFVQDVVGREGPAYGTDVPLVWEISVDQGAYVPLTLREDRSLSTAFPAGPHAFRLRATATEGPPLGDGYYTLRLGQLLVPQL
jgi:hypothetical protein